MKDGKAPFPGDPKRIVADGYDRMGARYAEWAAANPSPTRTHYERVVLHALPARSLVLDLGCGAGLPTTRVLAERFRVLGVDLSREQVAAARRHVPGATFVRADMTTLALRPHSVDGVTAFWSFIHVPRKEHRGLLQRIACWLPPGGLLVATMAARAADAQLDGFHGHPMYWSGYDADTNCRLVRDAGLRIASARTHIEQEFGEAVAFLWLVARKP